MLYFSIYNGPFYPFYTTVVTTRRKGLKSHAIVGIE